MRLIGNLLATGFVLAGIVLAAGFVLFVNALERSEPEATDRADAIVALTGGSERIADAVELLARGNGSRLLITGVNERTTREEIARQRPDLRQIFECCVDLDYAALNTIGNAEQTRRWVERNGFRSLLVVTSTYHMPRTLAELGHALPGVRLTAHAVVPERLGLDAWWLDPTTTRLLATEYVKYIVAVARIHLDPQHHASGVARAPAPRDSSLSPTPGARRG